MALVATLVAVAGLVVKHPGWWEHDLASISPIPATMRAQDASLRREMGAPEVSVFLASRGASEAAALEAAEAILPALQRWQDEGLIHSYDSPVLYLPAPATQAARLRALPDTRTLEANLRGALKGLAFRPDAFEPFVQDVAAARVAPPLTRAAYAGTPLGSKLNSHCAHSRRPVAGADLARWRHRHRPGEGGARHTPRPETQLVDLKQISAEMLDGFRGEAVRQAALGAFLILVLLVAGLASLRRAGRVAAPVAAALPLVVALLVVSGQRIGVFHLVALLLVLGIGLNYALFFERPPADEAERERTRLSIALCSTTTVITFSCLALSATPVLHAIGCTVALGVVMSLVLAALWARPRKLPVR